MPEQMQVYIDDKLVRRRYPSTARANQLQKLLDVYVFRDVKEIDTDPVFVVHNVDTDEKMLEVMNIVLEEETVKEIGWLSPPDLANLCVVFFSGMIKSRLRLNGASRPSATPSTGATTKSPPK